MADWEADHFKEMYELFKAGESEFVTDTVREVTGDEPLTMEAFLDQTSRPTGRVARERLPALRPRGLGCRGGRLPRRHVVVRGGRRVRRSRTGSSCASDATPKAGPGPAPQSSPISVRCRSGSSAAIQDVTGAPTVYFMSFGENYPHFHFLVIARPADLAPEHRRARRSSPSARITATSTLPRRRRPRVRAALPLA